MHSPDIILKKNESWNVVKPRKSSYGNKNICGANIERIRKCRGMKQAALVAQMQLLGVDINPSSLSKLEGQVRIASDIELKAISRILGVPMETLVETSEDIENTPG